MQFRHEELDEMALERARGVYWGLVPRIVKVEGFEVPVNECDAIPGRVHYKQEICFPSENGKGKGSGSGFPLERELNTVTDLAKFFAKGAFSPQSPSTYSSTSTTKSAGAMLTTLLQKLRF